MVSSLPHAVARTIFYADIFMYPLKLDEIYRWLIGYRKTNVKILHKFIPSFVAVKNAYYFIEGKHTDITRREKRLRISQKKFQYIRGVIKILGLIPTIELIGVTGALAMYNADRDDDIDICIIASEKTVWTTRFLTVVLLELMRIRRRPREKKVGDKVCANMFLDASKLALPMGERDLYAAHEILQMKPLYIRSRVYEKFLKTNEWVKRFLPNAYNPAMKQSRDKAMTQHSLLHNISVSLLWLFEPVAQAIQLWYMHNHRTIEIVQNGYLRFHPQDARLWIMNEYKKRLDKFLYRL